MKNAILITGCSEQGDALSVPLVPEQQNGDC